MLVVATLFISGCQESSQPASPANSPHQEEIVEWPCIVPPTMTGGIPSDTLLSDQASFNCMAWQQFIALNTVPGDKPETFGDPNDLRLAEFETYNQIASLFHPDGSMLHTKDLSQSGRKMFRTSKFGRQFGARFGQGDNREASGDALSDVWLADRDGNLVWYEVLLNNIEMDYIESNGLTTAKGQSEHIAKGNKIDLPKGYLGGPNGAMELKVAWLSVEDPTEPRWQRYKMALAQFCDDDGECVDKTVALVGMHIIHKTTSQPSWIWTTFEHVDNAPERHAVEAGLTEDKYLFHRSECNENAIPKACRVKNGPTKTSCQLNAEPAYRLTIESGEPVGECQPYPIQVAREYPIPATLENPVKQTNDAAHKMIRQVNAESVYQYYRLINVIWNDSPDDQNVSASAPVRSLSGTGFRPNVSAFPVSNPVMETYEQHLSCIVCHAGAGVAKADKHSPPFTSDYSFIFGIAEQAGPNDSPIVPVE